MRPPAASVAAGLRLSLLLALTACCDAQWWWSVYAGSTSTSGHVDGALTSAATFSFFNGQSMAFAPNGTLYIADTTNLRVITPGATSTTTLTTGQAFTTVCVDSSSGAVYAIDYTAGYLYQLYSNGNKRQICSMSGSLACAVEPSGNIIVAQTFSYNLIRVDPSTGATTALLNGGNRYTIDGVGTAAYSHETYCVWVEPTTGDIIWCDYGGTDGTGTGSIRRRSAATTATSIMFNITYPRALTLDASGTQLLFFDQPTQNLYVYSMSSNSYTSQWFGIGYAYALAKNPITGLIYAANSKTLYLVNAPAPSPPPYPPAPPPGPPPPPRPPGFATMSLSSCGYSTQYSGGYSAAMAYDGNTGTNWASASVGPGTWICVSWTAANRPLLLSFAQRQDTTSAADLIVDATATFSDSTVQTLRFSPYSLTDARATVWLSVTGAPLWVNFSVVSTGEQAATWA